MFILFRVRKRLFIFVKIMLINQGTWDFKMRIRNFILILSDLYQLLE
jgi:hypothetical protein